MLKQGRQIIRIGNDLEGQYVLRVVGYGRSQDHILGMLHVKLRESEEALWWPRNLS